MAKSSSRSLVHQAGLDRAGFIVARHFGQRPRESRVADLPAARQARMQRLPDPFARRVTTMSRSGLKVT